MPEMQYHRSERVKIQKQAYRRRCQALGNGEHQSQGCEAVQHQSQEEWVKKKGKQILETFV